MDPFSNVYPTLVECFGIVLIGYLCGRINILSETHAHGIQIYISRVALPAIIFKSMVELDFSKVNWAFWFGILTAKAALFLFVLLLTLLVSKPVSENLGKAGLFAIFVTQSNDLALGLPLFDAIFKTTHPEYLQYIYLLIPVSIGLLNPIGLLLLELNKNSSDKENNTGKSKLILKTLKGIITNPLVFMVIFGLIVNQVFTACEVNKSNWFLTAFLRVLAESFGATALFYLGFSLVGNMKNYRGFDLVIPFLLVACKSLILPMMARQTVSWFKSGNTTYQMPVSWFKSGNTTYQMHPDSDDHAAACLPSFAFIYGTLPTAPTVVVFATMYNVQVETIGTSMVLGTLLSAPIMFVSSKMISMLQSAKPEVDKAFEKATFDIGILSAVCCVWVFVVFFSTKFHKRPLHKFTMCLILNQLIFSVASSISETYSTKLVLAFYVFGLIGSYCWTALLSYALFIVRCRGEKYLFKIRWFILATGLIFPLCLCLGLALTKSGTASLSSDKKNSFLFYMDQNKCFNWILVVVLICCVITTIVCLIVLQRCDKYCRCKNAAKRKEEKESLVPDEESVPANKKEMCRQCQTLCQRQFDVEDLPKKPCCHEGQLACCTKDPSNPLLTSTNCDTEIGVLKDDNSSPISYGSVSPISNVSEETFDGLKDIEEMTLDEYFQGDRHQLSRHIILILFLSFFSILNVFLCLERIFGRADNMKTGIFIEIEFLVVICTLGQGFVSFSVFGFNKMFFNFISFERLGLLQPFCLAKKIRLKPVSALDAATQNLCLRFKIHHLERCQKDLVKDLRFHFRTYKEVYRGDQMVDWLIEFGLANTRMDAVHYGNCLLRGGIMEHCAQEHYFYDLPYFYRFCSEKEA